MDFIQDYLHLLPTLLPASLSIPLLHITTTTLAIIHTLQSHLSPLITRILTKPDITSLILLVILLFVSFKIVNIAFRAVMFWVNMILRLMMWGSFAVVGLWIYQRGIDGFIEDIGALAELWGKEYERFSGEVKGWKGVEEERLRTQRAGNRRKGRGNQGWGGW